MDTNEINQIYNEYSPQNIHHNLSIDGHKLCSISGVKLDWIHNELLQDNYTISNYQKDNNCIYVNWNKKTKALNRKVAKREKVYVIKALQGVKFSDYVDSSKNVYAVHVEKYRNWLKEKFKIDETIKNELLRLVNMFKNNGELILICWCAPELCHGNVIKDTIIDLCHK